MNNTIIKKCNKHGETKHFKRKETKNTYRCSKCSSEAVTKRRQKLKQMAVEYKGGECKICGYKKCIASLTFHHLNPAEKDFSVSDAGHTRSWDELKNEINKCELLCHNCHNEVHAGITKL